MNQFTRTSKGFVVALVAALTAAIGGSAYATHAQESEWVVSADRWCC